MGMLALHDVFPEVAAKESRMLRPINRPGLPEDDYVLVEHYCVDPTCDCRRVVIGMVLGQPPPRQVATINHAFEVPTDGEPQTFLDPLNPQSDRSEPLLGLFLEMLNNDPDLSRPTEAALPDGEGGGGRPEPSRVPDDAGRLGEGPRIPGPAHRRKK
jgi:hypothetical protein